MARKKTPRSDAKVRSYSIYGMRKAFALFSPAYGEVRLRCRVELPKYSKTGLLLKSVEVLWKCEKCKELVQKIEIDHIEPVIPYHITHNDLSIEEIFNRINCPSNNLQGLCLGCHYEKTQDERIRRKSAKEKPQTSREEGSITVRRERNISKPRKRKTARTRPDKADQ